MPFSKVCENCHCDVTPTGDYADGTANSTLEECKYYCFKNKKCQGIEFDEDFGSLPNGTLGKASRCYICDDPQRNLPSKGTTKPSIYRKGRMKTVKLCNKHFRIMAA